MHRDSFDSTEPTALLARGVSKRFGHICALEDVSLDAHAGEILAIVGDNGAGKSTLLKILTGVLRPDSGEVVVAGRSVRFRSPSQARRAGIAAVFQDLALIECLDIATNIFLGDLPHRGPFVDRRRMDSESARIMTELTTSTRSGRTEVGMLTAGQRQIVAIARALRLAAPIVVMDEPTGSLGITEKGRVAAIIDDLRARGRAVVLVSHDLELVLSHADTIHVLRLGRTAAVRRRDETDRDDIVGLITGALVDGIHV